MPIPVSGAMLPIVSCPSSWVKWGVRPMMARPTQQELALAKSQSPRYYRPGGGYCQQVDEKTVHRVCFCPYALGTVILNGDSDHPLRPQPR